MDNPKEAEQLEFGTALDVLNNEAPAIAPAELEQKMLEKENTASGAVGNPEDLAAAFFKQNGPRLRRLLSSEAISRRGLERAIICATSYPIVPPGYKPQGKEETELAWVMEQMVACKVLMIESMKLHKLNNIDELKPEDNNLSLQKGEKENDEQ